MATKIIVDTNFLFIPSKFRLDVFEELNKLLGQKAEPVMLSPTYQELQKLAESKYTKTRRNAVLGLRLVEKCRVVEVERKKTESNDGVILRIAAEWKCPVATNDRELRRRLRSVGVAVVFLRQKSRLEVDGNI